MNRNLRSYLGIFAIVLLVSSGLVSFTGCAKKKAQPAESQASEQTDATAAATEEPAVDAATQKAADARDLFINETIHFDYDKSQIRADAEEILNRKAEWLKSNPDASVIIEGHCDERGSAEYNLALGDRRAESAKQFLIALGISASRLSTISYGKEKPMVLGQTEEAYSKNRRAQFVIQ